MKKQVSNNTAVYICKSNKNWNTRKSEEKVFEMEEKKELNK